MEKTPSKPHARRQSRTPKLRKHREHRYRSGPSRAWLKVKNPKTPGGPRFLEEQTLMSDEIIWAVLYCENRAAEAEHLEERDIGEGARGEAEVNRRVASRPAARPQKRLDFCAPGHHFRVKIGVAGPQGAGQRRRRPVSPSLPTAAAKS
jgi:hypothetical protein